MNAAQEIGFLCIVLLGKTYVNCDDFSRYGKLQFIVAQSAN